MKCQRCGKCCLANVFSFITPMDIEGWKQEGRDDILKIVNHWEPVWMGDHLVSKNPGTHIHGCPFIDFNDGIATCTIYDTRPKICREYRPGSSRICPAYWQK